MQPVAIRAKKFRQEGLPRQGGEQARLKVVKGPDYGCTYVVFGQEATIGRGENNDIVISDLKSSRTHARIAKEMNRWVVRDEGSSNGIKFGQNFVRTAELSTGDVFILGETSFEFVPAMAGTQVLKAPASDKAFLDRQKSLNSITGGRANSVSQASGKAGSEASPLKMIVITAFLGIVVFYYVIDDLEQDVKSAYEKEDRSLTAIRSRDLRSYLPPTSGEREKKAADQFYRLGFREYREGNYLRARTQFETALTIDPLHKLARFYQARAEQAIEKEVEDRLKRGEKSFASRKIRDAKANYQAVMRLLFRSQSDERFIEAKKQLEEIEKFEDGEV